MAHQKKSSSPALDKANTRLSGIKAIDAHLDLDDGFTVATYEATISDLQNKIIDYNTTLSMVDQKHFDMKAAEKALNTMSERMLTKVEGKYGKDTEQYEKAGGVRKSLRKKSTKKAKA